MQVQKQELIQKQTMKFVGLQNTGNLCYLNSTMQVLFSLPSFCDEVLQFFERIDPKELNDTSLSMIKKLKEKKQINEGESDKKVMDLSELRLSFNKDLEKRHRDSEDTFGMKQNDSSEFFVFLFEFLIKYGKNQDLKKKNKLLGIQSTTKDNPPSMVEKLICRRNFNFGKDEKKCIFNLQKDKDYFINESLNEQTEFQEQMDTLENHLMGKANPVEDYFFNGHVLGYVGPCKHCKYVSLSIIDFAFFELNFNNENTSFFRYGAQNLEDMIADYFKSTTVQARCKNMKCDKYPVNIMESCNATTIYVPGCQKKTFLINVPKVLKFLFKKYEWSGGKGSKLEKNVNLPIVIQHSILAQYHVNPKNLNIKEEQKYILQSTIEKDNQNYYLFAFSQQSGSLNSGHYISTCLQYYQDERGQIGYYYVKLNDSNVSQEYIGGSLSKSIETDAYWAIYVREDQKDFQNQLINNKPPQQSKGFSNNFSFL